MMKKAIITLIICISANVKAQVQKDSIQLHPITDSLRIDLIEYVQALKKSNMGINDFEKAVNVLEGFFLYSADKRKKLITKPKK